MSHVSITYVHTLRTALHKGLAPSIMADAVADMAHDAAMNGGALDKVRAVVADCQSTDKGKPRTPAAGTFPALVLAAAQHVIATSAAVMARPEHKSDHGGDIGVRRERASTYAAAVRQSFVEAVEAGKAARAAAVAAGKAARAAARAAATGGESTGADGAGQGEGTNPESTDGLRQRLQAAVAERDALAAERDALAAALAKVTAERDALAATAAAIEAAKGKRLALLYTRAGVAVAERDAVTAERDALAAALAKMTAERDALAATAAAIEAAKGKRAAGRARRESTVAAA